MLLNDMVVRTHGLSICTGIGGLELGLSLALNEYRTICHVEREAFPAAILVKRMEEMWLDQAPIWSDIRTFDGAPWRGITDIISAGFPCQPHSQAGKRRHEKDDRWIWPDIARTIEVVGPALVFLENVNLRAFQQPYDDLQAMGFKVSNPFACTAAEMGAGHLRRRVFVLAHDQRYELREQSRWLSRSRWQSTPESGPVIGDPFYQGGIQSQGSLGEEREWPGNSAWWRTEPKLERVVHGLPNRVDRDRALGNSVVPIVAAYAFTRLAQEIGLG